MMKLKRINKEVTFKTKKKKTLKVKATVTKERKARKPPDTPNSLLRQVLSRLVSIEDNINLRLDYLHKQIEKNRKEVDLTSKLFNKHTRELNDNVAKLNYLIEETDTTLSNVLLAIKQNEYLQAWYPEQSGYPAMKVIGKHPKQRR